MDGLIEGFERSRLPGHGVEIDALVGGDGPPLLLLHGFPQTRMMWKRVAPALARDFRVVVPDLRGYGRSGKPVGGERHARYSKRELARDQVATMHALGFDRFAVAGHDRGARVAYRLALDHPEKVSRLAVLDILPTADVWARADADTGMDFFHWFFLAQPEPVPETLIGANPDFFLRWTLQSWAAEGFWFDAQCMHDYLACFRDPATIHAICEEYRASWSVDRALDEADRGVRRIEAPTLVIWPEQSLLAKQDPLATWRAWAGQVEGRTVPGGHFVCEEAPDAVAILLKEFFS